MIVFFRFPPRLWMKSFVCPRPWSRTICFALPRLVRATPIQVWFTRYRITFHAGSFSWIRYRKCSGVWVFTQRVIPNSGAEHIGFIRSRVNKTPIRYETESDTLVIRYRVNGATVVPLAICHLLRNMRFIFKFLSWCNNSKFIVIQNKRRCWGLHELQVSKLS